MIKPNVIQQALLDETISRVAGSGLEQISLRAIATRAGCTTAVIFQRYGGKSGLLTASLDRALARDTAAHDNLFAQVDGLLAGHESVSDFLASYVGSRARNEIARFWSEVLFKSKQIPRAAPYLARWHAMRIGFWRRILSHATHHDELAATTATYIVMEEVYAYPLGDNARYQLLLRETARALTQTATDGVVAQKASRSVSALLDQAPLPSTPSATTAYAMREQLLRLAIQAIVEEGIGTVSQRSLTEKAAASSSMIAYHFKNMKSFVNEAVWRALVHDIPHELDPSRDDAAMPTTMEAWLEMLDAHIQPRTGETPAGFYTAFARITGQACLLADTRSSLMPLVENLRALEGWGTYRVSRAVDSSEARVTRDRAAAFGMWIKGEAVLREAGLSDPLDSDQIARVAAYMFPPSA